MISNLLRGSVPSIALAALLASGCSGSDVPVPPPNPVGAGILNGASLAAFQAAGWTICYDDTYTSDNPLTATLAGCTGKYMMLACRATAAPDVLTVAAADETAVVTRPDPGDSANRQAFHASAGVGWYFTESWSWGFFPASEPVDRFSCDVASTLPEKRLCWHTGPDAIVAGYRCGATAIFDTSYHRLILVHD